MIPIRSKERGKKTAEGEYSPKKALVFPLLREKKKRRSFWCLSGISNKKENVKTESMLVKFI